MLETFIQQGINALQLGSYYSLIALGYCLVYGVLLLINFAHGDIFMVGAYIAFFCATAFLGKFGFIDAGMPGWIVLALTVPLTMLLTSGVGVFIERVAYRPLRLKGANRLYVVITALMMGIVLLCSAVLLERAADESLHHALAIVCAIAGAAVVLFPLRRRKAFRIDITGLGQIRLVDTSLVAEAGLARQPAGNGEEVQLLRGSTFWSSLMVLRLQSGSGRVNVLVILPDSIDGGAFRALSVACRWIMASTSRNAVTSADISPRSD